MTFTPPKGHSRNGLAEGSGELSVRFTLFEKYLFLLNFGWENSSAW